MYYCFSASTKAGLRRRVYPCTWPLLMLCNFKVNDFINDQGICPFQLRLLHKPLFTIDFEHINTQREDYTRSTSSLSSSNVTGEVTPPDDCSKTYCQKFWDCPLLTAHSSELTTLTVIELILAYIHIKIPLTLKLIMLSFEDHDVLKRGLFCPNWDVAGSQLH